MIFVTLRKDTFSINFIEIIVFVVSYIKCASHDDINLVHRYFRINCRFIEQKWSELKCREGV